MTLHAFLLFCSHPPKQAMELFFLAFIPAFFAFFLIDNIPSPWNTLTFCAFPLPITVGLYRSRETVELFLAEASPAKQTYTPSFKRFVISAGVFGFLLSCSQSVQPTWDFGRAFDISYLIFALIMAISAEVLLSPKNRVGTFSILKVFFVVGTATLSVKLIIGRLMAENNINAVVDGTASLIIFMEIWLLAAFVGNRHDARPTNMCAFVFIASSLCMAAGWLFGLFMWEAFDDERVIVSIALGCLLAIYSTFGFSLKDFPRLLASSIGSKCDYSSKDHVDASSFETIMPDNELLQAADEALLTQREKQILILWIRGFSAQSIADKLTISIYTVRTHTRNIYSKFEVNSRSELLSLLRDGRGNGSQSRTGESQDA